MPRLVPRERPLPRRLKGTALGEVLLEGTRGELQEVLVAAQATSSAYTRRMKAPSCAAMPRQPPRGGGGDGGDGRRRRMGGCGLAGTPGAAAARLRLRRRRRRPPTPPPGRTPAHLSSKAASPLARSSDGRAAHTAPSDPGGEPGSATPVASARIATQTYSKHSSDPSPSPRCQISVRGPMSAPNSSRPDDRRRRARNGPGPSRRGFHAVARRRRVRRRPPPRAAARRGREAPKVGELRHNRGGITREGHAEEHLQRRRRRLRARRKSRASLASSRP